MQQLSNVLFLIEFPDSRLIKTFLLSLRFPTKLKFIKTHLHLLAVILVACLISSCQKDITEPTTPVIPPVVNPNDSITVLSRLAYVDINSSATETEYREFAFDSLKRVQTITLFVYNNAVAVPALVDTYYYNGNDTLVSKKIEIDSDPQYGYLDSYFYFYDSRGRLIKDSIIHQPEIEVWNYTYSNATIIAKGIYYDPADPNRC